MNMKKYNKTDFITALQEMWLLCLTD